AHRGMGDQFLGQQARGRDALRLLADPAGVPRLDRDIVAGSKTRARNEESVAAVGDQLQPDSTWPVPAYDWARDNLGKARDRPIGRGQRYLPDGPARIRCRLGPEHDLIQGARWVFVTPDGDKPSGLIDLKS